MLFFEGDRDSSYDDYLNDLQKGGDGECRLERWWLYNWHLIVAGFFLQKYIFKKTIHLNLVRYVLYGHDS